MGNDGLRRVRAAVWEVINQFDGVTVEETDVRGIRAFRVQVGDQHRVLRYSAGDVRAHLNARAAMRRLLVDLGAVVKPEAEHVGEQKMVDGAETSDVADEVSVDLPTEAVVELTEDTPSVTNVTENGYVIFTPRSAPRQQLYERSRGPFLAIKIKRELIADIGDVLVIPLDLENEVWVVQEREFQMDFGPKQTEAASPAKSAVRHVQNPSVSVRNQKPEVLDNQPGHVAPEHQDEQGGRADPEDDTRHYVDYGIGLRRSFLRHTGFRYRGHAPEDVATEPVATAVTGTPEAAAYPPAGPEPQVMPDPIPTMAAEDVQADEVEEPEPVKLKLPKAVTPALGRILLVMYFLHGNGQTELAPQNIKKILSRSDSLKMLATIGEAARLRYVLKGRLLESGDGTYFRLSASGRRIAGALGSWPYDEDGLSVPQWVGSLIAQQ